MTLGPKRGAAPLAALPLLLFASVANGGVLEGRVLDPAGAPLPGASVRVEFVDGVREPERPCDLDGRFRLPVDRPGALVVRCFGFEPSRRPFALADTAAALEVTLTPRVHRLAGVEVTGLRRPARSDESALPIERIAGATLRSMRLSLPVISQRLARAAEVTLVGRDEYNAAPAVRGLARFRTVLVLDGARIHSDREIGPTAGFVDPATLEAVEVIRGPGSVLYGSDAIGGVVALTSQDGAGARGPAWVESGFSTVNRGVRTAGGAAWSLRDIRLGATIAHASAGDYALPGTFAPWADGARLAENSGFQRTTGRARLAWRGFEAATFVSRGEDIGRPGREDEVFTIDREEHVIQSLSWRGAAGATTVEARGHLHPSRWLATVEQPQDAGIRLQDRDYRSFDWGLLLTAAPPFLRGSWVVGTQLDARSNVRVDRKVTDLDSSGAVAATRVDRWIRGASAGQAGLFAHAILGRGARSRWIAGARLDRTWRDGPSREGWRWVPTVQLGAVRDLGRGLALSANAASAFREPTVSELYFTGERPAGTIIGNPLLEPERSYQLDLGASVSGGPVTVHVSTFAVRVQDWILLRREGGGDTLVYANAAHAALAGGSLELRPRSAWSGLQGWIVLDAIYGEDQDGTPLMDLHAPRARLEILASRGLLGAFLTWRGALPHRRIGPGEVPSAGYGLLDAGVGWERGGIRAGVAIENLLDQEAYEGNDPIRYPSPGRSFHVSLRVEP